jgi:tripartite-type tricarboxylate transporter receptor subunit TctC
VKFFIRLMACVLLFAAQCGIAYAKPFPDKPVYIYVGFPPGTSVDIVARLLAAKLGEAWGQTVIVENRPGAGGNIAANYVVRAAPDGYSLLLGNNSVAISGGLYPHLAYVPLRDLTAVSQLTSQPLVLVVKPSLPVKSVKDLIALAKASPGKLNFGSGGVGNTDHLAGELFKSMAAINIVHIPYSGGNQAMTDTIGGQVTMYFAGLAAALPLVQSGQLKALATTGTKRAPTMPNVPTMAQAGVPGYDVDLWSGLMAPAATPKPVIDKMAADIDRVLKMPDVRTHFAALGLDVAYAPPATFEAFFRTEAQKWAQLIKAHGITVE